MSAKCQFPNCQKPAYWDSVTGQQHQCCGRVHAQQYAQLLQQAQAVAGQFQQPQTVACPVPGCSRPGFFDPTTGRQHQCCGLAHAQRYSQLQQAGQPVSQHGSQVHTTAATVAAKCQFPPCHLGQLPGYGFCSPQCSYNFRQLQLQPAQQQMFPPVKCALFGCQSAAKPGYPGCSREHSIAYNQQMAAPAQHFSPQQFVQYAPPAYVQQQAVPQVVPVPQVPLCANAGCSNPANPKTGAYCSTDCAWMDEQS